MALPSLLGVQTKTWPFLGQRSLRSEAGDRPSSPSPSLPLFLLKLLLYLKLRQESQSCNALSPLRLSEGNPSFLLLPDPRIRPSVICSLDQLNLAVSRISEGHVQSFRTLVLEILILIPGIGTGDG